MIITILLHLQFSDWREFLFLGMTEEKLRLFLCRSITLEVFPTTMMFLPLTDTPMPRTHRLSDYEIVARIQPWDTVANTVWLGPWLPSWHRASVQRKIGIQRFRNWVPSSTAVPFLGGKIVVWEFYNYWRRQTHTPILPKSDNAWRVTLAVFLHHHRPRQGHHWFRILPLTKSRPLWSPMHSSVTKIQERVWKIKPHRNPVPQEVAGKQMHKQSNKSDQIMALWFASPFSKQP